MSDLTQPFEISTSHLTSILHQLLGNEKLSLSNWSYYELKYNVFSANSGGIYRFSGTAILENDIEKPWSLILKIIRKPIIDAQDPILKPGFEDPVDWSYWRREFLFYTSNYIHFFSNHYDLEIPKCFDAVEKDNDTIWIWLEDLSDIAGPEWPLSRFELAAQHLGSFQGRMMKEKQIYSEPWFTHRWLRSRVLENTAGMPIIFDDKVWKSDLVLETVPTQIKDSARLIWENREKLLFILDGIPKTVCHYDVWPPNLFARSDPKGREQTIIIDWSSVGWGAPGEDIGNLIPDSIFSPNQIHVSDLVQFEQIVIAGYLRGLHESGWEGDIYSVVSAYSITTVLAWGLPLLKWILEISSDKEKYEEIARSWEQPIHEIISQRVIVIKHFLENGIQVLNSK
ncbi:phosphotransferase [Paenibacillus contaminans]|uniref:Aminoglycoside phosphotransferase domain-containing protein n=1 Tax=Paenibacillus contaminans TaxID=450362 RepID=A0A329MV24_9BACL|nr:phosphotransferase [Paenibacillus contaminans]RAV23400.1 hypothetical protein DQG23_04185 [Paenibacillus contaminans]